MKKILLCFAAFCAIGLSACNQPPKNEADLKARFTGEFEGVLPCADCSGIETVLTLNPDYTFSKAETYIDGAGQFFTAGVWTVSDDLRVIELAADNNTRFYFMFEGPDKLKMLDRTKNVIKSELNYTLLRSAK